MLKKLALLAAAVVGVIGLRRQAQAKNEKELWREATSAPDATSTTK